MLNLLQMSLAGGALCLLIALARPLLLRTLPKRVLPALWLVAALRLLLPFSLPLRLGFVLGLDLAAGAVQAAGAAAAGAAPEAGSGPSGLFLLWLAGAAAMLAWFGLGHIRSLRLLRQARPCGGGFASALPGELRLRRRVEFRASGRLAAPMTCGVFRPVILLPAELAGAGSARLPGPVLLHEYVHIRRFDALKKQLFALCLCLHWFDPLVWLMYALAGRDLELACDEAVLARSGCGRRDYALTLISFAERRGPLPSAGSGFCGRAAEERIRCIMRYKKKRAPAAACALLLVLLAAGAALLRADRQIGDRRLWSDTAAFSELAPGAEQSFPGFVSVTEDAAEVQYVYSYARSGLRLELGLRDAQGVEYAVAVRGGGGSGSLGKLPEGEYELFVRSAEGQAEGPSAGQAENWLATGAVSIILNA